MNRLSHPVAINLPANFDTLLFQFRFSRRNPGKSAGTGIRWDRNGVKQCANSKSSVQKMTISPSCASSTFSRTAIFSCSAGSAGQSVLAR